MGDVKQRNTHRERERERHKEYNSINKNATVTNNEQPTFKKGYKVTLYIDSLTALYAIYTNGPNLGYQRG